MAVVPCSRENNCYPGTCTSGTCDCPAGFNGTNCLTSKLTAYWYCGTVCGRELMAVADTCVVDVWAGPWPSHRSKLLF